MPNKTIYVSDGDLPVYERAQELAGGSLSAAIAKALRRYIAIEEAREEGFEEIVVKVGPGQGTKKQRFLGVLLAEFTRYDWRSAEVYKVYGTRTGKFAVHLDRSPDYKKSKTPDKKTTYATSYGERTLQVFDSLDQLRTAVPEELYAIVAETTELPEVEDLDI